MLKDITTPTHHCPAGTEIAAEGLDGPLTAEDWQRLGHLEAPPAAPKATTPKAAPPAAPREDD